MTDEQNGSARRGGDGPNRRDFLKAAGFGAALLGTGAGLAGCGSSPTTTPSAQAAGKPKFGGTLRAGVTGGGSTDTLNPFLIDTSPDIARCFALYEPLTYTNAAGVDANKLAQEFTSNADATMWTLRLHSGIEFHNGKSLTADDVIYSLQYMANPKTSSIGAAQVTLVDIAGLRKLDPLTVQIPMKSPLSVLPDFLAGNIFYVVPEGWTPKSPPNGTGPFKYKSFTPGVESVFVANKNYWGGRPYVDEYVITDYASETSQVNALLAGNVDLVNFLSTDVMAEVQSSSLGAVVVSKTGSWYPFTMRVDQAPFNDARVRQAMRLIVDRVEMNKVCQKGLGKIGNDIFSPYDPAYDHSIPQRVQDIDQAKSLLKAAGHEGLTVTLVTSNIGPTTTQQATVFAQQASAAGVKVNLNNVTSAAFYGPNYLSWTFAQDGWNTHSYLLQASLATIPGPGAENETHFNNPRYNSLFNEAIRKVSEADRIPLCHEMQMIDYTEGGLIIPFFETLIDGYAKRVHGVKPCASGISFNNFDVSGYWLD
jgi:peptide/nickel transport system substrate-binding protein